MYEMTGRKISLNEGLPDDKEIKIEKNQEAPVLSLQAQIESKMKEFYEK
jgi:hypothetical protein